MSTVDLDLSKAPLSMADTKASQAGPLGEGLTPPTRSGSGLGGDGPGSIPDVASEGPSSEEPQRFSPPGTKITIGSLDTPTLTVSAQYNPRELQVDRAVPWQHRVSPEVDRLTLEYTGEEARTLSLELLFDGYEEGLSIRSEVDKLETMSRANIPTDPRQYMVSSYDQQKKTVVTKDSRSQDQKGRDIVSGTEQQQRLYKARIDAEDTNDFDRSGGVMRPHLCTISWGGDEWLSIPLIGVIDGIRARYTMFSDQGIPLRATVNLSFKEAHSVGIASEADRRSFAEKQRMQLAEENSRLNRNRFSNEQGNEDRNFQTPTPVSGRSITSTAK